MKKFKNLFALLLTLVLLLCCVSITAYAAQSAAQDGLSAVIETDKTNYEANEPILVTVTVTNNNSFAMKNVSIESVLPASLTVQNGTLQSDTVDLEAGEELTLTFTAVLEEVLPAVDSDSNGSGVPVSNVGDDMSTIDKSTSALNQTNSVDGVSPLTGAPVIVFKLLLAIIMVVSVVFAAIMVTRKNGKKVTKFLSLALSVVICASSFITTGAIASADEVMQSFSVDTSITVNGNNNIIKSTVSYEKLNNDNLKNLTTDEDYILVGAQSTVVFTVEASDITDSVALYDDTGKTVGIMHDDGLNGDMTAGDNVYAYQLTINPQQKGHSDYYAKSGSDKSNILTLYFFTQEDADKSNSVALTLDEKITDIESQFSVGNTDDETAKNAVIVYQEIVAYLDDMKQQGQIVDYVIENTTFEVNLGIGTYVYELDLAGGRNNTSQAQSTFANTLNSVVQTLSSESSDVFNVLTIEPYASELNAPEFDNAAQDIDNTDIGYDFSTDVDNGEVTVEFLKHLSGYRVIIWNGHGGYSQEFHSFLGIGESSQNASEKYSSDIANDRLIYVNGERLAVTSKFFKKYYKNSPFDNALIYLGACHGADDNVLADTLMSCGAKTVLGYSNSVYTVYNNAMGETFFEELTKDDGVDNNKTQTAKTALQIAKEVNGDADSDPPNWWDKFLDKIGAQELKEPAELKLMGDQNFRLVDGTTTEFSGTVSGKVCDALSTNYIENATLTFYSGNEVQRVIELKKNDEGYYSVKLPVGSYKMVASSSGYKDFIVYFDIERNENTYIETLCMVKAEENAIGEVQGTIRGALTGNVIGDVSLKVRSGWNNTQYGDVVATQYVEADTAYALELPAGNYTIEANKNGYITSTLNIYVINGYTRSGLDIVMTPTISDDNFRIVLTWGENPRDLDSHVQGTLSNGNDFHVYYGDKSQYDGDIEVCNLDVDDTTSYGPETITLNTTTSNPYYYYIYHFSGSGTVSSSGAQIRIYQGDNLLGTFNVPVNQGSGKYWNVFAIVNGEIIVKNEISSSPDFEYAG